MDTTSLLLVILLILCCLFFVVVLAAAAALWWVWLHPMVMVKRMRAGQDETPGNLSYPPDYEDYRAKVELLRSLPYPGGLPGCEFDLYLPRETDPAGPTGPAPCPLVVWVHGGSFVSGVNTGVENLATMLAAKGYAVLAPNYAVAPEHPYPAAVAQLNGLLHSLAALVKDHPRADAARVFLAGDSAGAQIISQCAAVETNPAYAREMGLSPGLPAGSLQGLLLCCGPYDLPAMAAQKDLRLQYMLAVWGRAYFGRGGWAKSPPAAQTVVARHVGESWPPTYLTDGNTFSFEAQARRLAAALRARGVPVVERYFPKEQGEVPHEYQFLLAENEAMLAYGDMLDFLSKYTK